MTLDTYLCIVGILYTLNKYLKQNCIVLGSSGYPLSLKVYVDYQEMGSMMLFKNNMVQRANYTIWETKQNK